MKRNPLNIIAIGSLLVSFLFVNPTFIHAVDICDTPLEATIATEPPIVMFIFDNSGSMDLEFMTEEFQGLFEGAGYLFPDDAYSPAPDHEFGAGLVLSASDRRKWHSQWAGYNHIYYSPGLHYAPWPATQRYAFKEADLNRPVSDPVRRNGSVVKFKMAAPFFAVRSGTTEIVVTNAHYFTYSDDDGNAHWDQIEPVYLVTWTDSDQDGILDLSEVKGSDQRRYFRLADDGDGLVEDGELIPVTDETEKNLIRPVEKDISGRVRRYLSDKEELQNFANWFSYYRRREFVAKAAMAQTLSSVSRLNVGFYAINAGPRTGAVSLDGMPADESDGPVDGVAEEMMDDLYGLDSNGPTPLRTALDQVGRYLHQDYGSALGESPFGAQGSGGCQRACAVIFSDGFWNDHFYGVGNADGNNGQPFADAWSETLADIAMTYYENDLGPNLPDMVPPIWGDPAAHQHMNTYTVSLGHCDPSYGRLAAVDDQGLRDCMADDPRISMQWPQPLGVMGVESHTLKMKPRGFENRTDATAALEDLRHAAVNGRGRYFNAFSSQDISQALPEMLAQMTAPVHVADAAVDSMELTNDSKVFTVSYRTKDWSGEVSANHLASIIGQGGTSSEPALWHASKMLMDASGEIWDQRRIVTYGGKWMQPQGIPFRYDSMSPDQLSILGDDPASGIASHDFAKDLIAFIRGKSFPKFRRRETLLGDIVHSGPVLFGRTLFVGSNDGMLHAFDANSGAERFAYVPNLVYDHLKALSDVHYLDRHRCYVDGPLYAGEVMVGEYQRKAYLVGGLGKGGKGYFCLLLGQRERSSVNGSYGDYHWIATVDDLGADSSEIQIGDLVRWEYPRPDVTKDSMDNDGDGFLDEAGEVDPNMGYSFGQAYAVNANCASGSYRPVVIFGNGYNSDSQKALLYVLAVDSGEIVRIIDTGSAGDNGLSTPALIDVDLDRRVDYAYAGDLNGNLWKFDLTDVNPDRWGVAYGEDVDGDGVINAADGDLPSPLFQAQGQPITGRPDVMGMHGSCAAQAPGYMVIFGTGRYLGTADRSDGSQQSLYAIWDYGDDSDDSEYLGSLMDRDSGRLTTGLSLFRKQIIEEASQNGTAYRRLSADEIAYSMVDDEEDGDGYISNNKSDVKRKNPDHFAGWFYDFPTSANPSKVAGERVLGNVAIRDGKIVVSSYVPDNSPCSGGGRSWIYLLTACNGDTPLDKNDEPLSTSNFKGKISDRPVILKDPSRAEVDLILFSDIAGNILSLDMEGEHRGKVYWRQDQ